MEPNRGLSMSKLINRYSRVMMIVDDCLNWKYVAVKNREILFNYLIIMYDRKKNHVQY